MAPLDVVAPAPMSQTVLDPPDAFPASHGLAGLDTVDHVHITPTTESTTSPRRRADGYALDWSYADECMEALQTCGRGGKVFKHDFCGAVVFVEFRCDERACAKCSPRRTRRLRERWEPAIQEMKRPALFTLTVPNVLDCRELPDALELLVGGFARMRRWKIWPAWRGLWSVEITWSAQRGYHPHLHAIVDAPWIEDWDEFMGLLGFMWWGVTGALAQPDLTRPDPAAGGVAGMIKEAIKYVAKQWELQDDSLRAIMAVMGRRKMFNSFGGLKAVEEEEHQGGARCPKCQEPLGDAWQSWRRISYSEERLDKAKLDPEWKEVFTGFFYADSIAKQEEG